jgi:hypothetical protein
VPLEVQSSPCLQSKISNNYHNSNNTDQTKPAQYQYANNDNEWYSRDSYMKCCFRLIIHTS